MVAIASRLEGIAGRAGRLEAIANGLYSYTEAFDWTRTSQSRSSASSAPLTVQVFSSSTPRGRTLVLPQTRQVRGIRRLCRNKFSSNCLLLGFPLRNKEAGHSLWPHRLTLCLGSVRADLQTLRNQRVQCEKTLICTRASLVWHLVGKRQPASAKTAVPQHGPTCMSLSSLLVVVLLQVFIEVPAEVPD